MKCEKFKIVALGNVKNVLFLAMARSQKLEKKNSWEFKQSTCGAKACFIRN